MWSAASSERRGLEAGPSCSRVRVSSIAQLALGLATFYALAGLANLQAWVSARWGVGRESQALWQERIRRLCLLWRVLARGFGIARVEIHGSVDWAAMRGTVVAANHPSLLDALALLGQVPRAVCVMRAGLRRNLGFGKLATLAGFLANDRGPALVREGRRKLEQGCNLLVFPEGTRSEGMLPGRFRPGFALAAALAGARVLPVGLRYRGAAFRKGRGLLAPCELPVVLEVLPGELLEPEAGESPQLFAARVREACVRLLG